MPTLPCPASYSEITLCQLPKPRKVACPRCGAQVELVSANAYGERYYVLQRHQAAQPAQAVA